jgi:hypothetical protein
MRILDAVNRGEIKLGTEDFTFGGGSSTAPESQQGDPGARAGMLIGNTQGQRGGTGDATVGAQPPRGSFGGPVGIDKGYYAGRPYVDYIQTDEGTVAVDQNGNVVSGGMGRQQQGMVSTQPVGDAVPVSQEQQQNQNFMQLLQSLGLEALLNLFQPAVYGQGGASTQSGGMFGVPTNFGVAPTNVGYLPPQVIPLNPADMPYQSVAQQSGMLNQI